MNEVSASGSPPSQEAAADWACRIAELLPADDVDRLTQAALRGEPDIHRLRATVGSGLLRDACDQVLRQLGHTRPEYLSGLLAGATRAVERSRLHQSVSVVWTGPESGITSFRLTAAAITELISSARSSILLVSYATQTEPALDAALAAAVSRGVEMILLAERHADNPRYSGADTPFPDVEALRLHWPARSRPPGTSLHAKIIVVDDEVALVGSANLTNRAMESNLECGILLRGGSNPRAIRDHITRLYATGILRRL